WRSGNALIWDLPTEPVFVDPRFESYPHAFLREVADSYGSDDRLARLIDRFQPSWIFAEHFRDPICERAVTLGRKGWTPVYADSAHLILVRPGADTAAYRASHVVDWSAAIPDLLPGPPELRTQQIARFERLRRALSGAVACSRG